MTLGMALLDDIEAFLGSHEDISPTALGDRALGDRHFVRQLRNGRRVWPETEGKVRRFMAEHAAAASDCSPNESPYKNPADISPMADAEREEPASSPTCDPQGRGEGSGRAPAAVASPPSAAGAFLPADGGRG